MNATDSPPNNPLILTRLAGENVVVPCLRSSLG